MKANELRIGNYALWGNEEIQVEYFMAGDIAFKDVAWTVGIEELNPIPITEEWLLKFGFEKRIGWDDMVYYSKDAMAEFQIYQNLKGYEYDYTEVKYVHHLQNLYYALMGEELPID